MIYEKSPPQPVDPFRQIDIDLFTKAQRTIDGDAMELANWKPPLCTQGRAVEVFNERGCLLGTMIFVWSVNKYYLNWNQGGNK